MCVCMCWYVCACVHRVIFIHLFLKNVLFYRCVDKGNMMKSPLFVYN